MGSNDAFSSAFLAQARRERNELLERLEALRIEISTAEELLESLRRTGASIEGTITELDHLLGISPQMRIAIEPTEIRGEALRELAVDLLRKKRAATPVHYRQWHGWVSDAGYLVPGKDPTANFLAQVSQDPRVRRVGKKSGLYELADDSELSPPEAEASIPPTALP